MRTRRLDDLRNVPPPATWTARPVRATLLAALACPALLIPGGCGGDADPAGEPPAVTASALPANPVVVPGGSLTIGWRFDLADGWHLYWNGRNDTGLPPEVALELPPGWRADPLQWPGAERHVSPGEILDHVYEGRVTLLQAIRAPANAPAGAPVQLRAKVSWLVCREVCIPGDTTLTLTVGIADPSQPPSAGEDPELVRAARRLPRPPAAGEIQASWRGSTLHVKAPGARSLEFHPGRDCGELTDPLADGAAEGDSLAIHFVARDGRAGPARGVLRVAGGRGDSYYVAFDKPATAVASPPPTGEEP